MAHTSLPIMNENRRDAPHVGSGGVAASPALYAKFDACVHCGLCLPACPTYVATHDEADSPRGRIHLMKAVVDGRLGSASDTLLPSESAPAATPISDIVFEHLDRCLVCRACETACPSGVQYHDLIEAIRPQVAAAALGGATGRAAHSGHSKRMRSSMLAWVIRHVLPRPGRTRIALAAARLARTIGLGRLVERVAPGVGALVAGAADTRKSPDVQPFTPAAERQRGAVVLLRGCVGSVISPQVNAACVRVLTRNGFDVHVLPDEPCCGALAAHANDPAEARRLARQLVERLEKTGGAFFISPIAGCGAQLKALHHVLADDDVWHERSQAVTKKIRDISEFLMEAGITPPPPASPAAAPRRRVTYHDPCHLAHAQRITDAPRQILRQIPALEIVPLAESDMCCGAAGTYSMNQPEMAAQLGQRKAAHIRATGATLLATANIGCALQIARHLKEAGLDIPVRHVVELLADAYDEPSRP